MTRIGIVGTGYMGSAVLRAIVKHNQNVQIGIIEKVPSRRQAAVDAFNGIDYTSRPAELFGASDLIILAIKPQDLASVAESIGDAGKNMLMLSMLAGTTMASVERLFGTRRVVRIMPNLAADIGKAVTGIAFSADVTDAERTSVLQLLNGIGTILEVKEDLLNGITGVSGSGIAFAVAFIHAMALAGVEQGLPFSQALTAATDVVESAALLLRQGETHPSELVSRVSSPGGTTIKGIRALEDRGFTAAVMAAVEAAANRSRELES